MKNVNVVFEEYKEEYDKKYSQAIELNTKLNNVLSASLKDVQLLCKEYTFKSNVSSILEALKNKDKTFTFKKLTVLLKDDVTNPGYSFLLFKLQIIFRIYTRLYHSNMAIEVLKYSRMPYITFNHFNTNLNLEMSKSILRGYSFPIGLRKVNIGSIHIQRITRKFDETGTPKDKSVNWEESKKFKQALIDKGIAVYNKDTCPDGKKWFIYHTDEYVYYINWKVSIYIHKFIKFFKFKPTIFINTKNRLSSDILDDFNTDVESIINNPKLGFANKLQLILKHDPSYGLKYNN